ncbi:MULTISPECIES: hydroxyacylglutathione hydrolase C-terminal domain-containing protein [unclassified Oceanobacter]|uniref:hydroxyacylglutathione hydrolase C-terminal domain-containing protein n=1 Tax=unclassified Oceanobacter TaxID=2620260 RepID=UPI0026E21AAC|nr:MULTISPECIES: hydroxyacylglutathione hydrolase C-terminal domain-containing protein [unclassified Oceanobacter]MDO6683320.1 hydroxyacylglutathione hydrolase C-terminal domain-containing protein [Oceanobacter sp. 5_MG-2023]MDP2504120.1 hydroxyacylglutathione hydrolase C-terminal domain-containing protein [Oceanobacter sp. 3_MG-2023]MDP2610311.1 hydroxyacylglutathione hydrolase C-terminal domain-containing protein [Oceanobacter sp. 1_MG-2023]MDP2613551.1 hydroxyacylglutathione hydrolase C-term
MIVLRRYMNNNLRNYNYLIGCEETRQAIAVDPLGADEMLALAEAQGYEIKLILNTHEHHDHIDGNPRVQQVTGAAIWAHKNAADRIPNVARWLVAGDVVELGTIRLRVLFTPGHTMAHLCLLSDDGGPDGQPLLFSGDTLFNACAGNCSRGGDVDTMYDTFVSQFQPLPDDTLMYPGHDYMKNNLGFALSREPDNDMAQYWLDQVAAFSAEEMPVMTLGQERTYNPFLRLHQPQIRAQLQVQFPEMEVAAADRDVFRALRALRDAW